MGWRYFLYSMGGLMMVCWFLRFLFHLHESPKFLIGRGRDAEAVKVMQAIAEYNGRTCSLTLDQLEKANQLAEGKENIATDTSAKGAVLRKLKTVSGEHVKSLFATKKLAWSTSLLIAIWGASDRFPNTDFTSHSRLQRSSALLSHCKLLHVHILCVLIISPTDTMGSSCISGFHLVVQNVRREPTLPSVACKREELISEMVRYTSRIAMCVSRADPESCC